jgi:hypothetical protein
MITNCCLEEAVSFLLNEGLRKTTNQYGGFGMTTNQIMIICYFLIDRTSKPEARLTIFDVTPPC